jgi:hypothetical protein
VLFFDCLIRSRVAAGAAPNSNKSRKHAQFPGGNVRCVVICPSLRSHFFTDSPIYWMLVAGDPISTECTRPRSSVRKHSTSAVTPTSVEALLKFLQACVTGVQPDAVLEHDNRLPLTVKSELPDTVPIYQA